MGASGCGINHRIAGDIAHRSPPIWKRPRDGSDVNPSCAGSAEHSRDLAGGRPGCQDIVHNQDMSVPRQV